MTARDWFAVYGRLLRLPKFRALDDADQLTVVYIWALSGDETPEATWSSAEHLDALLQFNGRPAGAVPGLIAGGWLDIGPDGSVTVHDWDEWQMAATREARNAWEARYMRGWRKQKREAQPPPHPPVQHNTTQHRSKQRVNNALTTNHDGVLPEPPGLPSPEEAKRRLDEIRAQFLGDPPTEGAA